MPDTMRAMLLLPLALMLGCSNALTRQTPAPSTAATAASVMAARVNHALHAAAIEGYAELDIRSEGHTVVLEGNLATAELVDRAVAATREVEGVGAVDCRIAVGDGPQAER